VIPLRDHHEHNGVGTGTTAAGPVAGGQSVVLPTGQRVRLARDVSGRLRLGLVADENVTWDGGLERVTVGEHVYLFPRTAKPYLGRGLDLRIFDVTALASTASTGRIPLRLTYTSSRVPNVPGLHVTSARAGAADGYLTARTARVFGAALAARYRADAATGFRTVGGLFGGARVTADLPGTHTVTPMFPMRTLVLRVLDFSGKPAGEQLVTYLNMDEAARSTGFILTQDGEVRLSVPVGVYGFTVWVEDVDRAGNLRRTGLALRTDVRVTSQPQVVVLDARMARNALTVRTPRPSVPLLAASSLTLADADGVAPLGVEEGVEPDSTGRLPQVLTPSLPDARVGTLASNGYWLARGTRTHGPAYEYTLTFPAAGIPARQNHVVHATDLATTAVRVVPEQGATSGELIRWPVEPGPDQPDSFGVLHRLPGRWLASVNTGRRLAWQDDVEEELPGEVGFVDLEEPARVLRPGSVRSVSWGLPVVLSWPVQVPRDTPSWLPAVCLACRGDQELVLGLNAAAEGPDAHYYDLPEIETGSPVHARLQADGHTLADQQDSTVIAVSVPTRATWFRYLLDVDRSMQVMSRSTRIHTDLRFRSAAGLGVPLARGVDCPLTTPTGCRVLPVPQLAVALPVNARGELPSGTSTVRVVLGHVQGAARIPFTSWRLEVRRAGRAWHDVALAPAGRDGVLTGVLATTTGDAGSTWDVRVSATDAAGGQITQIATAAFVVGRR